MQQVYIPKERIEKLKRNKKVIERLEKKCNCKIKPGKGNYFDVEGEAYGEYLAKNIILAFGRGFSVKKALKLLNNKYYISIIDLEDIFDKKDRLHDIKSRIIGRKGKAKRYTERVSSAMISIYENTVCIIGDIDAIKEAETAIKTLINGGSHRKAYERLEALHKKNKNL